jgi:hypothetical protein
MMDTARARMLWSNRSAALDPRGLWGDGWWRVKSAALDIQQIQNNSKAQRFAGRDAGFIGKSKWTPPYHPGRHKPQFNFGPIQTPLIYAKEEKNGRKNPFIAWRSFSPIIYRDELGKGLSGVINSDEWIRWIHISELKKDIYDSQSVYTKITFKLIVVIGGFYVRKISFCIRNEKIKAKDRLIIFERPRPSIKIWERRWPILPHNELKMPRIPGFAFPRPIGTPGEGPIIFDNKPEISVVGRRA